VQVLNSTAIASGYAGRAMEAFSKFSFMLQRMVKFLLLFFKRKEKNKLQVS